MAADDDTPQVDPVDAGTQAGQTADTPSEPMPDAVPGSPESEQAYQDSLKASDEYTKQLKDQYQNDLKQSEQHSALQQFYIDKLAKDQEEKPPPPQYLQQQMPPMSQEMKGTAAQTVFNVLAVAASAFLVFGSRRNPYAQAAMMSGLGSFFSAISQGNPNKVKQSAADWHKYNEGIIAENKERLQGYKDILANKRLDLSQQMDLMRMKAEFYKDGKMESDAASKSLAAIHLNLKNKAAQIYDHQKRTTQGMTPKNSATFAEWRQLVMEQSGGKADINTPEGMNWAHENYPFSKFLNEKKTPITTDPETGKKTGGFSGSAIGVSKKPAKSDYEKHMDELYGALPDKTPDEAPSKSVLEQ
jgi:hypothetical protein